MPKAVRSKRLVDACLVPGGVKPLRVGPVMRRLEQVPIRLRDGLSDLLSHVGRHRDIPELPRLTVLKGPVDAIPAKLLMDAERPVGETVLADGHDFGNAKPATPHSPAPLP